MKKLLIISFLLLGINSVKCETLDSAKISIIKTLAKADTNVYKVVIVDEHLYVLNKQNDIVKESVLEQEGEITFGTGIFLFFIFIIIIFLLLHLEF